MHKIATQTRDSQTRFMLRSHLSEKSADKPYS